LTALIEPNEDAIKVTVTMTLKEARAIVEFPLTPSQLEVRQLAGLLESAIRRYREAQFRHL